jgi:hypothetical protein
VEFYIILVQVFLKFHLHLLDHQRLRHHHQRIFHSLLFLDKQLYTRQFPFHLFHL